MSIVRHYFPGNNTPQGFFSYYDHILGQREANKIVCIKGGPGTGKSTFLKKIGEKAESKGLNVDFLHCSADANSLDGILLPDKRIAFIDGTSPHVIDPITPGAVDEIINFGEYWNSDEISKEKDKIINYNEECSKWYHIAYNYLRAAKSIGDNLSLLQANSMEESEVYKLCADIIDCEYSKYDIAIHSGKVKKAFATGITPSGTVNMMKSLLSNINTIYLINVPEGYQNLSFMRMMLDGALFRGFDVETYYCPMAPSEKIEHIIIPELSLAFVTTNCWHDIEPWELTDSENRLKEITLIDLTDVQNKNYIVRYQNLIQKLEKTYSFLFQEGIHCLEKAKEYHDLVEKIYIRNMSFDVINQLMETMIKDLI